MSILYYKATRGHTDLLAYTNANDLEYLDIHIFITNVKAFPGIATGRNTFTQIKALDINLSGKGLRIEHGTTGFKSDAFMGLFWTSV